MQHTPPPGPIFTAEVLAAAVALRDRALGSDLACALVESLTTEVGPRFAGTPGDQAARDWALRNFSRLGFDANAMKVEVPVWRRGMARLEVAGPWTQPLYTLAIGGSVPTPPGGLRAAAIAVRDLEELSALPRDKVEGRIVFLYDRMRAGNDDLEYARVKPIRREGAAAAAAQGAVAVAAHGRGNAAGARAARRLGGTHGVLPRLERAGVPVRAAAVAQRARERGARELRAQGSAVRSRLPPVTTMAMRSPGAAMRSRSSSAA